MFCNFLKEINIQNTQFTIPKSTLREAYEEEKYVYFWKR